MSSADPSQQSTQNPAKQHNEQPQQDPPQNTTDNMNQIVVELHISNTDEHVQQNSDTENQDNIQEALEVETKTQHIVHPSIVASVNKKVTWKECLSPYHLARLGISGGIAMLTILTFIVGVAYALNPKPCIVGQPNDADKVDPDAIYNMIIAWCWWSIFFASVIKLLGHEWLWTPKKINYTITIGVIAIFVLFVPAGFFSTNAIAYYFIFIFVVGIIFGVIYVFALSGFYVFWLVFPFGVAAILLMSVILIGDRTFEFMVNPDGPYFPFSYWIYLSILQSFAMKFHLYQFPYKWGKCFTCCCNKHKSRKARSNDVTVQDELSDTFLFWYSMVVISIVETFRMAGYTSLQDEHGNFTGLYLYILTNIFTEVITRNAIVWEILYKCLKKKPLPRSRVDAIYYGATNQGEFIPIWTLLLINLTNFGPQSGSGCCRYRNVKLSSIVKLNNWWLIPIALLVQLVQIIVSELMVRFARWMKWYGMKNEKGEDPPRRVKLVTINLILMIWVLIVCYACSLSMFFADNSNRSRRTNGEDVQDSEIIESTMFSSTMMFDFESTMISDENTCT